MFHDYFSAISCLQTDDFVNNTRNSTKTLTDLERVMIREISQELNDALQPSADENKPIPPQDLRTVASFVQVVAK